MKILNLFKMDNRDKSVIYQEANKSFEFDYSIQTGIDDNGNGEPSFKDASECIDKSVINEMKEVDYYA